MPMHHKLLDLGKMRNAQLGQLLFIRVAEAMLNAGLCRCLMRSPLRCTINLTKGFLAELLCNYLDCMHPDNTFDVFFELNSEKFRNRAVVLDEVVNSDDEYHILRTMGNHAPFMKSYPLMMR